MDIATVKTQHGFNAKITLSLTRSVSISSTQSFNLKPKDHKFLHPSHPKLKNSITQKPIRPQFHRSYPSSMDKNHNHGNPTQHTSHKPISKSELLSSAKVVAEAAKIAMGSEKEKKMDKGKVAGAAAGILGAACQYGKLEEKSYGKYVGKAEDYLHQYQSKTNTGSGGHSGSATTTNTDHGQSGGGFGNYMKMAEGVLKHKQDGSGGSGGGYGDYVKMAEGLLKKK